ncbi:MAG TPA: hypothetical protein VFZ53_21535 [Polyangiaceae bacterium]
MTRSRPLLLAFFVAGCSFTEIPPAPGSVAVNQCEEDQDCGNGRCRNDMCVASTTSLSTLLIEVTPPTTVADVGGMTFFTTVNAPRGNLEIGPAGTVTATITAEVPAMCSFEGPALRSAFAPSGGTIPARISFLPHERAFGVAVPTYGGATGPGDGFEIGGPYTGTMSVPPGTYDMYIEPRPIRMAGTVTIGECDVPPLFVRGQEISGSLALAVALPSRKTFSLTLRGPAGDSSLTDWSVEVLDADSGRVLSAKSTLAFDPTTSEYSATVAFVPAQVVSDGQLKDDGERTGSEIFRVSPPSGVVAPSFFFSRKGLGIFSDNVVIDLAPAGGFLPGSPLLPPNAAIEGQTTELDTGTPVAAAVTLTATGIDGASNNASFITTIQVDENGKFATSVPPGTYNVRATPPPALGLAAADATWEVRSTLSAGEVQAGKTIELSKAPFVWGEAFANGGPIFGATAMTVVSPGSVKTDVIRRTLEAPPVVPRTSSDLITPDGGFEVPVDPGLYDFFVQPEARARYPWLVLPAVQVPTGGLNLGRRRVSPPFVYRGEVLVDATMTRVPGALIRAYVYVTAAGEYTSDPTASAAVVPVAETRADDNGAFELLIPASLDKR